MKRYWRSLALLLALLLTLCACSPAELENLAQVVGEVAEQLEQSASAPGTDITEAGMPASDTAAPDTPENPDVPAPEPDEIEATIAADTPETAEVASDAPAAEPAVLYGDDYYSPEDVALYLHLYRELPPNYLTKAEARDLGWESSEGNLWDVFPGGCIGGDRFGNYEEQLPEGRWTECDVNYAGGYRGGERLVFNDEGAIYYTNDHYESFTLLYERWAEE